MSNQQTIPDSQTLLDNLMTMTETWPTPDPGVPSPQPTSDVESDEGRRGTKRHKAVISQKECRIFWKNTVLLVLPGGAEGIKELSEEFCGTVLTDLSRLPHFSHKTVYLCGDLGAITTEMGLEAADRVFIIKDLSHGHSLRWPVVGLGRVPLDVHGVGIMYRRFFDGDNDFFQRISTEHAFQALTESNKPGKALRTGLYLTPVEQRAQALHFNLLRCSSNLSGPTANFRSADTHIVDALNQEALCMFRDPAPLNHVLAQIYYNTPATASKRQSKAKIKAHADKTKDMPFNSLMAFVTFYDNLDRLQPMGPFDFGHPSRRKVSGLTKLYFRLKDSVAKRPGCSLAPKFQVTLYPNSAFFMPISTNRSYTHEIRPSALDAEHLPTRMGYVVRCSATQAVHENGHTYLKSHGKLIKLEPATPAGTADIKGLYAQENSTDRIIEYKHPIPFSMNKGDYSRPEYASRDEFRSFHLEPTHNLFPELFEAVSWEDIGHGRQGTVLVQPGKEGVPIVRTTAKFNSPAHCFRDVHTHLARDIHKAASLLLPFNNALYENYTNAYCTMGFHSDQALDLEQGSSIALFSCYRYPDKASPPRKLVVECKEGGAGFEIPLTHNSVVVFSLDTNRRFRHKIVLDTDQDPPENQWLGVTFRTSKTFVKYTATDGCTRVLDNRPLRVLPRSQRGDFYKLRKRENRETNFRYPSIAYTVSESDLLPPIR